MDGLHVTGPQASPHWRISASRTVSYEVRLSTDLLDPSDDTLADAGADPVAPSRRRLLVVDARVNTLFGDRIRDYMDAQAMTYEICVLDADERGKTMDAVFQVVAAMDAFGVSRRREPVLAIGGGVLSDIVGLATSLYRRTTPYVRVPTTLIGMVDAGIGAKTGVNFHQHKNRLGTYHPSAVTLIDATFLRTLPVRHLRNGLAEVLKIALVKDAPLFDVLERHGTRLIAERMQTHDSADRGAATLAVMRHAIHDMLGELQPNLWEHRLDRIADFGHTFSPAIEMHALPDLLHGEAVAVDMALSTELAHHRGLLSAADRDRIHRVITDLGLPTWHPVCSPGLLAEGLADTIRHRDGRQRVPLTVGIGRARFVDDLTLAEIDEALATCQPPGGAPAGRLARMVGA
ncbi:sedoheptulose 7-phosphate cyclase [Actinoplanes utahensis]|uniref:sedoheptulose 7-phosphate cyclase n=1 Tax=Actinoplanes utahensis TaxID=1869 RepID=UPI000691D95C|nr:sedoheptulose 7-phosphate cyclase [Actinoplanes utahensis]GIF33509.1 3-dehydroquinate synthase [Actinoplanes utahensis]